MGAGVLSWHGTGRPSRHVPKEVPLSRAAEDRSGSGLLSRRFRAGQISGERSKKLGETKTRKERPG